MKFLFAFLALLHLHQLQVQSSPSDDVSNLIEELRYLNKNSTINSTSSELEVPSSRMRRQAVNECCVWKFKEITMEALSSVTVPAGHECLGVEGDAPVNRCIEKAKIYLEKLPALQKCSKEMCPTKRVKTEELEKGPFIEHIHYLQKLNRIH